MIPLEELAPGKVLSAVLALVFITGLCACGYGLFKLATWVAEHISWL